jgi:hypothetical protein
MKNSDSAGTGEVYFEEQQFLESNTSAPAVSDDYLKAIIQHFLSNPDFPDSWKQAIKSNENLVGYL